MPISATGTRGRAPVGVSFPARGDRSLQAVTGRGFTLLELLVVIFIIGIVAAMATLSIGTATREKGIEQEVERLADLIALAREEASLQGREFGLTFYAREYRFSVFDPATGRWEPMDATQEALRARRLPADAIMELEIDGRTAALADEPPAREAGDTASAGEEDAREDRDRDAPQVFILSSGDVTPFATLMRPAIGSPGMRLAVAADGTTQSSRDEP